MKGPFHRTWWNRIEENWRRFGMVAMGGWMFVVSMRLLAAKTQHKEEMKELEERVELMNKKMKLIEDGFVERVSALEREVDRKASPASLATVAAWKGAQVFVASVYDDVQRFVDEEGVKKFRESKGERVMW